MTNYLPGTTEPNPTIVVLIDGEPYTYESNMSDAETTAHILTEDMGTDPDTVMIVEDVTPCTITPTSLGGSVICSSCGTYCACTVCSAD